MVELPYDENKPDEEQVIFANDDLWVPIACVNGNVHILPGVPRLFEALLEGMKPSISSRVANPESGNYRIIISTPLAESAAAGYLTELSQKVAGRNIKVGSYPRFGKSRNVVTLVGTDREYMDSLVPEVEQGVQGKRVTVEGEDDSDNEENSKKDPDA